MNDASNQRDIRAYEAAYASTYDFESVLVKYRREAVLASLRARKPRRVVEIGCGLEPLLPHYLADGGTPIESWIVVEPADTFVQAARAVAAGHPGMHVVQGFFEDAASGVVDEYGPADMVVCSGLLHEVPDAGSLLRSIRGTMAGDALLHVNVPNASSLHRRLAKAMGLIGELEQMSERGTLMQHRRVYGLSSLQSDLRDAGLRPSESGGIFLKPLTHAQMTQVVDALDIDVLPGLAILGRELPELAAEIYVEAMRDGE